MDIRDIVQKAHKQLKLSDLEKFDEGFYDTYRTDSCTYVDWLDDVKELGYDTDKFYVDPEFRTLNSYYYVGDYVTIGLPTVVRDWLSNKFTLGMINADAGYKELFESEENFMYFFPEGNTFVIDYFVKHYDKIPDKDKFERFKLVYTFSEEGFSAFPKEVIDDVISRAPRGETEKYIKENCVVKNGKVRVYRGVHSVSTPIEQAMSWTLSKKTAREFANRFEKGTIYTAWIPVDAILHINNEREEQEVWAFAKDMEKLKKIK